MHALATKRGLVGLVVLVVWLAASSASAARPGTPPPPPLTTQGLGTQIHIPPFAAPAAMPALGEELARALYAALRDANIPARLGKGDEGSAISGRLEEISQTQVRLHASYHGHSVQSVGDLEHLDDLVFAVFTQLRPRLQASTSGATDDSHPVPGPSSVTAAPPLPTESPDAGTLPSPPAKELATQEPAAKKEPPHTAPAHTPPAHHHSEIHPASLTTAKRAEPTTPTGAASSKEPAATAPGDKSASAHPAGPNLVPEGPPTPTPPSTPTPTPTPTLPGTTTPPPPRPLPPVTDLRRPRVAVHIVGDPVSRLPPGYYGLGTIGQQNLMNFLQHRLRVPAAASRLVGLTGGLTAMDQSLQLGAHHTLMVRMDSLILTPSPGSGPGLPPAGTLAGRVHIVLLFDGKLLLDRSIPTQPTLVLPTETAAQAYSRVLLAAVESVAGELAARLQPPPG